jgi:TRL-like protein family
MPIEYLIIFLEKAMTWDQIEDKSVGLKGSFGMLLKTSLISSPERTARQRRFTLRAFLAFGVMGIVLGLSGCMIVDSPIKGVLGTEVFWGDIATGKSGSSAPGELKQGKACAESILGLLARGDASVRAAKENGNISEVTSVDHSARNLLNIVGEWCTIVRGH